MRQQIIKHFLHTKLFVIFLILGHFSGGCSSDKGRSLEEIIKSGKLIVLTRNAPTTYYLGNEEEPTGPEYEMVESFAKKLGVKAEYRILNTVHEILETLDKKEGDIAAAGLTQTKIRSERFLFGPIYQEVRQQIVCLNGVKKDSDIGGLAGLKLVIPKNSIYEENLVHLKKKWPELAWESKEGVTSEQLLEEISNKEIDCTVADSNVTSINRRYFPELIVTHEMESSEPLAWLLKRSSDDLKEVLDLWFKDYKSHGKLDQVKERYYGFVKKFDYVDTRAFHQAIDKRYPKYRHIFEAAAERYGLDANLLAAHSYQESHWKPKAKSPTGVRGMMMLTLPTAKSLGVKSRLNAYENIMAGGKHFSDLLKSFSDNVKPPDLFWLALAAYNIGRGHLHDAQILARQMNKNPFLWSDLREVLPLLSNKKYYKKLKYGYARGSEPVKYVQRIRNYKDILDMKLAQKDSDIAKTLDDGKGGGQVKTHQ